MLDSGLSPFYVCGFGLNGDADQAVSSNCKGIILAGGTGTRLHPLTIPVSKQLMPVYDKPMIYYPLSTLLLAGICDILVITTPDDRRSFQRLLGDGSQWGIRISYEVQPAPKGIAQALVIGADFIGDDPVCLILGDNIFYGHGLGELLQSTAARVSGATIFGYFVNDPQRYGVIVLDETGKPVSIEEKPRVPKSNYAVTGLYFYDPGVVDLARGLTPSGRGELEITDVNRAYLERGELQVERLGRGVAWLDTGTHASLASAGEFVRIIEERQGLKICCPEEIAYARGLVDRDQMLRLAETMKNSAYGDYLLKVIDQGAMP